MILYFYLYLMYASTKNIFNRNIIDKKTEIFSNKNKCLIVNNGYGDSYRYRVLFLKEQLEILGYTVDIIYFDHITDDQNFNDYKLN